MIFEFDAAASNIDGTNPGAALALSSSSYGVDEFNAPAPPFEGQYASSVDTEGSLLGSRKHSNRQVSMTVACLSAAALRSLQAKVGKIAREGGTLKVTFPASSETVIFDLHTADTYEPQFDITYDLNSGAYCEARLGFVARPYARGPEQDLGDNVETTLPFLVFTDTGVKGDWYGLGRLVVDNDTATVQNVFVWGMESRYYSSASTAALFYQAESCALSTGTVVTGPAGSSGGGTNNTVRALNVPDYLGGGTPAFYIGASSTAQTHVGAFRVYVRVQAPSSNTGDVKVRASWYPQVGGSVVENDWQGLGGIKDEWMMIDLGEVLLPKVASGTQGWIGTIDVGTDDTAGTDDAYVDWVALVPVLEGSGRAGSTIPGYAGNQPVTVRHDATFRTLSGGYTAPLPGGYRGDHMYVPPGGAEARTVRVIAKFSRGTNIPAKGVWSDVGIDDISARLYVTPRYLVVPEP